MTESAHAWLTVDLAALSDNFAVLQLHTDAEVAAVVKANAYGCGVGPVVRRLSTAGCRSFFTAFAGGGVQIRESAPEADIYILNPVVDVDAELSFRHGLIPCLYAADEFVRLAERARALQLRPKVALYAETGMHRLGMPAADLIELKSHPLWPALDVVLILSHLACADEPGHPLNPSQRRAFDEVRRELPDVPASLANSGGIFLDRRYHYDMVRPGIALFGHDPHFELGQDRVTPVTSLHARVGQVAVLKEGMTIGYGATVAVANGARIATVFAGYADGITRRLGELPGARVAAGWFDGHRVPITGRVSMDLVTVDVTGCPKPPRPFVDRIELFGRHVRLEEHAAALGTIPYELLTGIGPRVARVYRR